MCVLILWRREKENIIISVSYPYLSISIAFSISIFISVSQDPIKLNFLVQREEPQIQSIYQDQQIKKDR